MSNNNQLKINNNLNAIGIRIRNLRESMGLTQSEFCKKNNLKTTSNLSAMETGKTIPTLDAIINICHNCNVSADTILFGTSIITLQNDSVRFKECQKSLNRIFISYQHLLNSEESRLIKELKSIIEKLDQMSTIEREMSFYGSDPDDRIKAQVEIYENKKFLKMYMNDIKKDIYEINKKKDELDDNKQLLVDIFDI